MRYPDDFAVARRKEVAMDDGPTIETCIFVAEGEASIEDFEARRLAAELATLRRDAALGALVRRLGHAALVRTPLLGWRVDAFVVGPQGRTWYAESPDETPEGALAAHFRLRGARDDGALDGPLATTTAAMGHDGERLATLERKAAAWDDRARWFALAVERFREAYIGQGETSDRAREIAMEDALLLSEEADHA